MDFRAFVAKWSASSAAERANKDQFLLDFCDVLGVERPKPTTGNHTLDRYVFEHDAQIPHEGGRVTVGKIDLYKAGSFLLEAKQGSDIGSAKLGTARRRTPAWNIAMRGAFGQALGYARTLDAPPPFLIVCDIGFCFDLYASFDGSGNYRPFPDALHSRIFLEDVEKYADLFRGIFDDPHSLDPAKRAAKVTREIATLIAKLAVQLEKQHPAEDVAKFLMRCIFTMFAEDVDLLPKRTFADALQRWATSPERFVPELQILWKTMNEGGELYGAPHRIWRFNGGLFADYSALPLTKDQILYLGIAAESNWAQVEPAIFGTLLERALDPKERHRLGAHYTPRAYVERLIGPVIEEPLRAEWELVQAEVRQIIASATSDDDRKAMVEARKPVYVFYDRLCDVRVLDPACGSGNFLFVALDAFKRLENEILDLLHDLGATEIFNLHGRPVTPEQFLGIEIKPWAKEITELVLWIGWLQWQIRTRGWTTNVPEPVLRDYHNIERRDAVLAYDVVEPLLDDDGKPVTRWDGETMKRHPVTGEEVPDDAARVPVLHYVNPRRAQWPKADFIVGNPPFVGNWRMRSVLGEGYAEALREMYSEVPESVDYVMYWWHKAAQLTRHGEVRRFGFITTNSFSQAFARRVAEAQLRAKPPLSIVFAIPDHPWVDSEEGAAVRIAMTAGAAGESEGLLQTVVKERDSGSDHLDVTLESRRGRINGDLTIGADVTSCSALNANAGVASRGMSLHGSGFIVTRDEAVRLGYGTVPELDAIIREYRNGRDITDIPRDVMVIDLYGRDINDVRREFPAVYQHVLNHVKPERDQNNRASYRDRWWLFGEPRIELRTALRGLGRFISTVETAKHRVFLFLGSKTLPDNKLVNIALDDAFFLGVLSSRVHVTWTLAAGALLEDRPVYVKTDCFDPFPFPAASEEQKQRIRDLGEQLDAHRKRRQQLSPGLTITAMYNVLEKLRHGEELSAKDKAIHEDGLISVLTQIHDDLDAAVFDAYAWPRDLSDDAILERLVALNHERGEEEARGLVRWLRPELQARDAVPAARQETIAGLETAPPPVVKAKAGRLEWPSRLPDRITAVRDAFFLSSTTFDTETVARRFRRARRTDVEEVLESLEALGLVVSHGRGAAKQWKPLHGSSAAPSS
jgi:hypothetical protein